MAGANPLVRPGCFYILARLRLVRPLISRARGLDRGCGGIAAVYRDSGLPPLAPDLPSLLVCPTCRHSRPPRRTPRFRVAPNELLLRSVLSFPDVAMAPPRGHKRQ